MNDTAAGDAEAVVAGGEALIGLATLGKLTVALLLIVLIILAAAFLIRRLRLGSMHTAAIKVVGSLAVGPKERVVIVEVASTWLVLGVGSGQVNRLHKLPAPPPSSQADSTPPASPDFDPGDSFATRFAKALKHNAGLR
ncbi:flagellar biosynthetic protein FliO [Halochromatium salexigens]|uniref:Flagellar protein n=1 Tax=Halochromatium salexigens TaxID=49447 RepID=A0AAJ0UE71_HALSE|nr:flagellar biosynthetic protein FliO [Halochromatium salexigens]MBK5929787.1 flagellar biosynthetic protein FliO [Halochromatium salexigens]